MVTKVGYLADTDFPEFDRPPVVETAIGVVLVPSELWKLKHFTEFGRFVTLSYPESEPQDRLIQTPLEEFGAPPKPQQLVFEQGAALWWYSADNGSRLIQLQRDRFVHNWRKRGGATYPRYVQTREQFANAWNLYVRFLSEIGLPPPTVLQVEIDYINQIEKGTGWDTAADLPRITPLLATPKMSFLPPPEAQLLGTRYLMPERRGRLHVTVQPGIRNIDKVEVLQLTLTARGRSSGSDIDSIMKWCDLGHEWIVRGFVESTTPDMHRLWGRTR